MKTGYDGLLRNLPGNPTLQGCTQLGGWLILAFSFCISSGEPDYGAWEKAWMTLTSIGEDKDSLQTVLFPWLLTNGWDKLSHQWNTPWRWKGFRVAKTSSLSLVESPKVTTRAGWVFIPGSKLTVSRWVLDVGKEEFQLHLWDAYSHKPLVCLISKCLSCFRQSLMHIVDSKQVFVKLIPGCCCFCYRS